MFLYKPLLKENKSFIKENVKQAKQYVSSGKLSEEDLKELIRIDPTPTRKYVGWMAKQQVLGNVPDLDDLRNTVEEYHTFLEKGKTKTKDIYKFKTFQDLHNEVDHINQSGEGISVKDLESDYDVIQDDENLLVASPHTHEASRKLGLSHFAYRSCGDGSKDSTWCTTYKAPDHFNSYYYSNNVTFYYIKVRSKELIQRLKNAFNKWERLIVVAVAVLEDGRMEAYDGEDKELKHKDLKAYLEIVGIT